jgi:hypothetical protein
VLKESALHVILGGAALQRCDITGFCSVPASAAEVKVQIEKRFSAIC